MGKKKGGGGGENEKVVAARDRKAAQKEEKSARQAKHAEDAYWESAGEGAKSKAQKKKEEADARAAEAAKKKREAKQLAEAEERALASAGKKEKSQQPKMTAFERSKIKESDKERAAREAKEREMAAKRQVSEEEYARQMRLEEQNTNRNEDEIVASGLTQALSALTTDPATTDIHPEKRVKAAFNAYYEANLPELKSQKPGLRANQYRDMLWKQFQKSPENPMNRVQAS